MFRCRGTRTCGIEVSAPGAAPGSRPHSRELPPALRTESGPAQSLSAPFVKFHSPALYVTSAPGRPTTGSRIRSKHGVHDSFA
jgi:hypothetical protein